MHADETLAELLREYRQVEQEIEAMERDRQEVRARIRDALTAAGRNFLAASVDGEALYLTLEQRTEIVYNEDLLRERLGDAYAAILEPDPRKLRRCPEDVRKALEPYLDSIGAPSRRRIREAIERGELRRELFEGAFEKRRKTVLFVRKNPPAGISAATAKETEAAQQE